MQDFSDNNRVKYLLIRNARSQWICLTNWAWAPVISFGLREPSDGPWAWPNGHWFGPWTYGPQTGAQPASLNRGMLVLPHLVELEQAVAQKLLDILTMWLE